MTMPDLSMSIRVDNTSFTELGRKYTQVIKVYDSEKKGFIDMTFDKAIEGAFARAKQLQEEMDARFFAYNGGIISKPTEEIDPKKIKIEETNFITRVNCLNKLVNTTNSVIKAYEGTIQNEKVDISPEVLHLMSQLVSKVKKKEEDGTKFTQLFSGNKDLVKDAQEQLEKVKNWHSRLITIVNEKMLDHSLLCFRKTVEHGRPLTKTQRTRYATLGTTPILEKK